MTEPRTVLEHLLDGRDALVQDVKRLSVAIDELDSVIARIGGGAQRQPVGDGDPAGTANTAVSTAGPAHATEKAAKKAPARSARTGPTKKATTSPAAQSAGAPRSIRLHVLDMLDAEDREFGLAEIIDRIHAQGIHAHDDAVRSITIKLMKDGKVERVGRGQYRLARRGAVARTTAADRTEPPAASASAPAEAHAPVELQEPTAG